VWRFFANSSTNIGEGPIGAVYDRDALVALPEVIRAHYVAHLLALVGPETQISLATFDYDQTEMKGSPFSVPEQLVRELFTPHRTVTLIEREEVLEHEPDLKARVLKQLAESAFLIR
jgi:thiopurine S-methyltransferase